VRLEGRASCLKSFMKHINTFGNCGNPGRSMKMKEKKATKRYLHYLMFFVFLFCSSQFLVLVVRREAGRV
jgi:hypothetical protein